MLSSLWGTGLKIPLRELLLMSLLLGLRGRLGLLDTDTKVQAVWLPGGTAAEARAAIAAANEARPELAEGGGRLEVLEVPDGRGVFIFDPAANPDIAQLGIESDFSEQFLSEVLGYTQTQNPGDTHVVQVRDRQGRVVWSQSTAEANIEATRERARDIFPDTERYADPEVLFKEDAVKERWQKAKEEASKANYWSGGAAVGVALFYELCKASEGWIGGAKYQAFWQHEAMISTLTFLTTSLFAWVYKAAHPDSK